MVSENIMISYSTNREDVLLSRAFQGRTDGVFVDVGANHPVHGSTTYHLYKLGWRGICIDANGKFEEAFNRYRPNDTFLAKAVTDASGPARFFIIPHDPALSTVSESQARQHLRTANNLQHVRVSTVSLDEIFATHLPHRQADVLKVDVEGAEASVLRSFNIMRWRPRVVLVEAVAPCSFVPTHHVWEPLLLQAGYKFCIFDGVNRIYAEQTESELAQRLAWPVSSLDKYTPAEYLDALDRMRFGRAAMAAATLTQAVIDRARRFALRTRDGLRL